MRLGRLAPPVLLTLALLAAPPGIAQQGEKVHRIGFLRNGPPPETFIEGLRRGRRELGHIEGQNIWVDGARGSALQCGSSPAPPEHSLPSVLARADEIIE